MPFLQAFHVVFSSLHSIGPIPLAALFHWCCASFLHCTHQTHSSSGNFEHQSLLDVEIWQQASQYHLSVPICRYSRQLSRPLLWWGQPLSGIPWTSLSTSSALLACLTSLMIQMGQLSLQRVSFFQGQHNCGVYRPFHAVLFTCLTLLMTHNSKLF